MDPQTKRILLNLPALLWTFITGALEWLLPESWCAKDVSKDIVLITGAGSGLGRAMSLEYAKLGSSLVLWDINEKGLEETKKLVELEFGQFNHRKKEKVCLNYLVDVSNKEQVKHYSQRVYEDLNKVEGKIGEQSSANLKDEQIERIFKINILAHFWTVRAFLPNMIKHQKGHIVEIASMAGHAGLYKSTDYCATKFATVGFEEALSVELFNMGLKGKIHTTVVCPLFFNSNLYTDFDTSICPLMTVDYVAKEAVKAMRCNHSRILLSKFKCYSLNLLKPYLVRDSILVLGRALGMAEGVASAKGRAAQSN